MSESDLDNIWKMKWDETYFNMMMHDEIKTHLNHIWIRFKQNVWVKSKQDLSQIWAEERRNAV